MKIIDIYGENYTGQWNQARTACRAIVIRDGKILLSYETKTGQYMIPGGGLEPGEDEKECAVRELSEETGFVIEPSDCLLEIDEYYETFKWVSRYFTGTVIGMADLDLTDREKEVGMEPRWVDTDIALEIFSKHSEYADTDEMRRGMYYREYTALKELVGNSEAAYSIGYGKNADIDEWMELVEEICWNFPGLETKDAMEEHRITVLRFMSKKQALCAKTENKIIGVLLFSRGHNMICCLGVSPEHRRHGVASQLLSKALEQLDRTRDISVSTFRENDEKGKAPRALYKKYGFKEDELIEEYGYPNQRFVLSSNETNICKELL